MSEVLSFSERSSGAECLKSLGGLVQSTIRNLGFEWYSLFTGKTTDGQQSEPSLCDNYPEAWVEAIVDEGLLAASPIVQASRLSVAGICWNHFGKVIRSTQRQREIRQRSRDFGLTGGFTITLRMPGESDGIFSVSRRSSADIREAEKIALRSVATIAYEQARRLSAAFDLKTRLPLAPRQIECTSLVAEGKTDWEIAQILGISRDTVHEYVESARKRYDVRTRTQLVVRAIRDGHLGL